MRLQRMLAIVTFWAILLGQARNGDAGFLSFNTDLVNTTGSVLNDYHVKLVSTAPITISDTFQSGGDVVFNSGVVNGNGTNSVTIDWSGATVNQGQTSHVGAATAAYDPSIIIQESWWTFGGVKFVPNTGTQATGFFSGGSFFTVARISIFDSPGATTLLGTEWMQGAGNLLNVANRTSDGPIYVKVATRTSQNAIPLSDLNFSLTGFGPDSPVLQLSPVPEPSSLLTFGVGMLCLVGYARRRRAVP